MDDGVDSGPIAGQKEEPILPTDTIATLYSRIEEHGLELLREALPLLARGTLKLQYQDEGSRRILPRRSPEDGLIGWDKDAISIDRFIRAQTHPYPGAFTTLEGRPLHIWQAKVATAANGKSKTGHVRRTQAGTYTVACGDGAIILNEISYEQKNYTQVQLTELFGGGGQGLGVSPS